MKLYKGDAPPIFVSHTQTHPHIEHRRRDLRLHEEKGPVPGVHHQNQRLTLLPNRNPRQGLQGTINFTTCTIYTNPLNFPIGHQGFLWGSD